MARYAMKKRSEQSQHSLRGFLHTELQLAPTLIELTRTHLTGDSWKRRLNHSTSGGCASGTRAIP
jgi:hypothetical protein